MKRTYYVTVWKNLVMLLQVICTILLVMACFLLTTLNRKNIVTLNNLSEQNYVESEYYSQIFCEKLDALAQYLQLRKTFETDGTYDGNRLINTGGTGLSRGNGPEGDEAMSLLQTYVLSDLVAWSKKGYVMHSGKIREDYLPIAGLSVADSMSQGVITQKQGEQLYQQLQFVLDRIGNEEKTYRMFLNSFDNEESNLSYVYMEDGTIIYTNMETAYPAEQLEDFARNQGSFLYCDNVNLRLSTNMDAAHNYYYEHMDGKIPGIGKDSVFMMAVNTKFPVEDELAKYHEEYIALHPWGMISMITIVICLAGWITFFAYLTIAAGRSAEDELVHLNVLDRIKTEIWLLGFVLLSIAAIFLVSVSARYHWDIPGMMVVVGTVTFLYNLIFMIFYLSMIRRMKAGVLWEYSLSKWIMESIKRMVATWKTSVRVILVLLCNISLFLGLAYGMFIRRSVLCVLFLCVQIAGLSILFLRDEVQKEEILKGIHRINEGDLEYKIPMEHMHDDNYKLAEAINRIGGGLHRAVENNTRNERMKASLITNVSHDIRTPLTSIINYVNLIKMEQTDNERIRNYLDVLEKKAQHLSQLTEDLVEASRISFGTIKLHITRINLVELVYQTAGEFNEKFEKKQLTIVTRLPGSSLVIMVDGRRLWRVLENLYGNVAKYAMRNTRVYLTLEAVAKEAVLSIKNISEQPIQHTNEELMERFARGDESRTTEGSGLGLSIASNLTTLMGGSFFLDLDGDLFTVILRFPLA